MEPLAAFLGIGLMVAIIIIARGYAHKLSGQRPVVRGKRGKHQQTYVGIDPGVAEKRLKIEEVRLKERQAARETMERLLMEKLEVLKLAVSMGYEQKELQALDRRLEELVGKDKLESLLNEDLEVPKVSAELMDDELQAEVERLAKLRGQEVS